MLSWMQTKAVSSSGLESGASHSSGPLVLIAAGANTPTLKTMRSLGRICGRTRNIPAFKFTYPTGMRGSYARGKRKSMV